MCSRHPIMLSKTFDLGFESDLSFDSANDLDVSQECFMTPTPMAFSLNLPSKKSTYSRVLLEKVAFAPLIPDTFGDKDASLESNPKSFKVLPRFSSLTNDILPMQDSPVPGFDAISSDEESEDASMRSTCSSVEESDSLASLPSMDKIKERATRHKTLPKKKSFSTKPPSPNRAQVSLNGIQVRRKSFGAIAA